MDRTQCWISVRSEFSELRYNGISVCEEIYGVVTSWCGTVIDCIYVSTLVAYGMLARQMVAYGQCLSSCSATPLATLTCTATHPRRP